MEELTFKQRPEGQATSHAKAREEGRAGESLRGAELGLVRRVGRESGVRGRLCGHSGPHNEDSGFIRRLVRCYWKFSRKYIN